MRAIFFMRAIFYFLLFSFLIFYPPFVFSSSVSQGFSNVKKNEPDFFQILKAFYTEQGLHPRKIQSLRKRIRRAAYLPIFSLGYDHQLKEGESLSVNDNISVSGGRVTIGPEDNDISFDNDLGQTFRVRAVWQLGELVFNRYELNLARQEVDLIKLKQNSTKEIYQVYEKRYQALFEYFRHKGNAKGGLFYNKYLLLTDLLDALTGGRFHDQFFRAL